MSSPEITRRALGGATLLGVATPLLVACGSDDPASSPAGSDTATQTTSPDGSPAEDGTEEGLVAASDVPVGGGVVVRDAEVVVTQPDEGTFKCFTAICTHQGCVVGGVSAGEISCNCHGSVFSAEDGSVVQGPAQAPLEEFPVTVADGQVIRT